MLRWLRMLWPLIFLLPLGLVAGRFCWLNIVDPTYHSLVWLHERLLFILVVLAAVSLSVAFYRFLRLQNSIRRLLALRSEPPHDVETVFTMQANIHGVKADLQYIDVPRPFCFTIFRGPSIVISRGFADALSPEELDFVARHEVLHVARRDPWRSIAWHLFFAGLVLPGFEAVEILLHLRRERIADRAVMAEAGHPDLYAELLKKCSRRRDHAHGAICNVGPSMQSKAHELERADPIYIWDRAFPAMVSTTILVLVLLSHTFFMDNLPYLQTHHC